MNDFTHYAMLLPSPSLLFLLVDSNIQKGCTVLRYRGSMLAIWMWLSCSLPICLKLVFFPVVSFIFQQRFAHIYVLTIFVFYLQMLSGVRVYQVKHCGWHSILSIQNVHRYSCLFILYSYDFNILCLWIYSDWIKIKLCNIQ